jgi:DNA-binding NarL/FixJ family response regulator
MNEKKIKILLADDHAVVRGGTKLIIENEADMTVAGEASDGEQALRLARAMKFDLALLDVNMPNLNGIRTAQQLKQLQPDCRVLILTGFTNESYIQASQEHGVDGFLLKERSALELITTIRMLTMGHQVFPKASLSSYGLSSTLGRPTGRELEIIRLVAEGLSNKEIAQQLSITERTVEYHLGNLYGKMMVSSRAEAVKKAVDAGWLLDI